MNKCLGIDITSLMEAAKELEIVSGKKVQAAAELLFVTANYIMAILIKIGEAMKNGDAGQTQNLTNKTISFGIPPSAIIKQILEPTMQEIGEKFRKDEVFIPDVLMSSRAMHASLYVLKPLISRAVTSGMGKVVLGTVAGDLHDIGKNMVGMMLEGGGYQLL